MRKLTPVQPHIMRRLLIFTLVALLSVAAVAFADIGNAQDNFGLQLASQQATDHTELSTKEIASRNLPSIVSISTESVMTVPGYGSNPFDSSPFGYYFGYGNGGQPREYRAEGAGSGIVISADGYILTNNHVIDGAETVQVTLTDDTTYDAVVVGTDADNDIAVLKVNATGLTPALFGDSDSLSLGETAMVMGNPLGEINGSVSVGVISALPRVINIDGKEMTLIQTDAAVNPGNSGGALINSYGEVVGIVTAKTAAVQVEGIGYAIPINVVQSRIEELVNTPAEDIPSQNAQQGDNSMRLGVQVYEVTPALADQYGLPEGVYVQAVEPFSAAEKAGIKAGDIIVKLGDVDTTTHAALEAAKADLVPGVETTITVVRNGQEVVLNITLGSAASA